MSSGHDTAPAPCWRCGSQDLAISYDNPDSSTVPFQITCNRCGEYRYSNDYEKLVRQWNRISVIDYEADCPECGAPSQVTCVSNGSHQYRTVIRCRRCERVAVAAGGHTYNEIPTELKDRWSSSDIMRDPLPERWYKPLFMVLTGAEYDRIASGEQTIHYRRADGRFGRDGAYPYRGVTLSRGYGKEHRMHAVISRSYPMVRPPEDITKIYPAGTKIFAIELQLKGE